MDQVSPMVSRNTTLNPSLGLRIWPACKAGLSAGMRRERVHTKRERKKEETGNHTTLARQLKFTDIATRSPDKYGVSEVKAGLC